MRVSRSVHTAIQLESVVNFGALRVGGCSSEGVAATWRFWRYYTTVFFCVARVREHISRR